MMDLKVLEKRADETGPYKGDTVAVKLKGYAFIFHRESDFVACPCFVPFFWKCKGDDQDDDGMGKDREGEDNSGPSRQLCSEVVNMEVDSPHTPNDSSKGKMVSNVIVVSKDLLFAITPFNPNPQTPRGRILLRGNVHTPLD
jgi:hypothetical protein